MADETSGMDATNPKEHSPVGEKPPVTEKAVKAAPVEETSQYVVTLDNTTGMPTKVEKLDEATGQRKELTPQEYVTLMAYGGYVGPAAALGAAAYSAAIGPVIESYWRGYTDYVNTLISGK